jgi:hypothetical protein
MRMIDRAFLIQKLIGLFLSLALVALLISSSYGEENGKLKYGISFSGGFSVKGRHSFTRWAFLPRVDLPLHNY